MNKKIVIFIAMAVSAVASSQTIFSIKKKIKKITCLICGKEFENYEELEVHQDDEVESRRQNLKSLEENGFNAIEERIQDLVLEERLKQLKKNMDDNDESDDDCETENKMENEKIACFS